VVCFGNGKHNKGISFQSGLFALMLMLWTMVCLSGSAAAAAESPEHKVIVFIVDNITLPDLQSNQLPVFKEIIKSGGFGLMNTRTKPLLSTNRTSAYLTVGMGAQIQVRDEDVCISNTQNMGHLYQMAILNAGFLNEIVGKQYPNNSPGKIGEAARQYGKKISLVGNADTDKPQREAALMAMDSRGNLGMGNTGRDLLVPDTRFPWGYRTNTVKLLADSLSALKMADILFIDFGDTARVGEAERRAKQVVPGLAQLRAEAMKNADNFLGELLGRTDSQNVVLMIISPTSFTRGISHVNRNLTPIIIYEKGGPVGVLTSNTTRRTGLVSNIDIGPAIIAGTGLKLGAMGFLGEQITIIPDKNNFQTVVRNLSGYINLKKSRYAIHSMYVLLLITALTVIYLPGLKGVRLINERAGRAFGVMVLALPAFTFFVPAVIRDHYYVGLVLIGTGTVLTGILLSGDLHRALAGMAWLSLATSSYIIVGLLTHSISMLSTPLGFNDIFAGGRYYGINNDCMGIMLGSTIFAMFYFFEEFKLSRHFKIALAAVVMSLMVLSQTPGYGAKVGGTIAAMTVGVAAIMVLSNEHPLKKKNIIVTIIIVFMIEILIAYLDNGYGQPTHAGKTIRVLISQGPGKFFEVLQQKLGLFRIMLVLPPWNIILGAEVYIIYAVQKRFNRVLKEIRRKFTVLSGSFEVILYGGLVAFGFNDTGVIATALMFTYLTIPAGVLMLNQVNTDQG